MLLFSHNILLFKPASHTFPTSPRFLQLSLVKKDVKNSDTMESDTKTESITTRKITFQYIQRFYLFILSSFDRNFQLYAGGNKERQTHTMIITFI